MGTRGNIFEQTGCLIYYLIPLILNAGSEGWGVAISIIAILLFVLISVERKLDISSDRARLKRKREYQDELMGQLLNSLENEGLNSDLQSNKDRLIRKAMELSIFESESSVECIDFSISVIKFEDYLGALIDNRIIKEAEKYTLIRIMRDEIKHLNSYYEENDQKSKREIIEEWKNKTRSK